MVVYAEQLLKSHCPIVTTNYKLVALLTIRAHSMSRPDLVRYVNRITGMPWLQIAHIHIDDATHAEAWALLRQMMDKEWSLVDAASFVVMRRPGITKAFTSDHHFTQASFVRVPQSLA